MTIANFMDILNNLGYEAVETTTWKGTGVTFGKPNEVVRPCVYEETINRLGSVDDVTKLLNSITVPHIDANSIFSRENLENLMLLVGPKSDPSLGLVTKRRLDLELTVAIKVNLGSDNGIIRIKKEHLGDIGMTPDELFKIAIRNTKDSFYVRGMSEVLHDVSGNDFPWCPIWVVSDAAAIAYPSFFKKFCDEHNLNGCWIIPSSIHELLIYEGTEADKDSMDSMVRDVNSTQVAEIDRLSDHAYWFDGKKITY